MKKRYLFFLRHYNDIDNIVPAIYYYLKASGDHMCDVIIYEPYAYERDPNIDFLRSVYPSKVNFFSLHDPERFPVGRLENPQKWTDAVDIFLAKLLQRKPPVRLVVFDVNRTRPLQPLLAILRKYGVQRIVALPVSPLININVLREYPFDNPLGRYFDIQHDYSGFDEIGYVDSRFADHYEKFHEAIDRPSSLRGKVSTLGSIRYCPNWLSIRPKAIQNVPSRGGRIKAVLFLSHEKSNVNEREVEKIVSLIRLFPEYDLIVKPHTRDSTNKFNVHGLDERSSADSSALIVWADVIFFWSTSIAVEGYVKGKTMVCLPYVTGNINQYALFNAGYVARCRDDLFIFLYKYKSSPEEIKYNHEGVRDFLENIVPGGDAVIQNYLDFMVCNERSLGPAKDLCINYREVCPSMHVETYVFALIRSLKDGGVTDVLIFGTGIAGFLLNQFLSEVNVSVVRFIDSAASESQIAPDGNSPLLPEAALEQYPGIDVVIASISHRNAMLNRLLQSRLDGRRVWLI